MNASESTIRVPVGGTLATRTRVVAVPLALLESVTATVIVNETTTNASGELVRNAVHVTALGEDVIVAQARCRAPQAIVSESHIMIHTWPEHGYAAVDVFTCGEQRSPDAAIPVIKEYFAPERIQVMEMNRGIVGV